MQIKLFVVDWKPAISPRGGAAGFRALPQPPDSRECPTHTCAGQLRFVPFP